MYNHVTTLKRCRLDCDTDNITFGGIIFLPTSELLSFVIPLIIRWGVQSSQIHFQTYNLRGNAIVLQIPTHHLLSYYRRKDALFQVCPTRRGRKQPDYSWIFALLTHYSFFKTLTNQTVIIELKNDIRIRGTLKSVDQYLNIKLDDVDVLDLDKYPHLSSVKNMFIRGSVVRYVVLPRSEVDVGLLEDATRRGNLRSALHAP
jgi:U6 snRNA-associated Sm-like protein LSm2